MNEQRAERAGDRGSSGDVAVVGMAVSFPQAATLAEFRENLRSGWDSVRPMPAERVETNLLDPAADYGLLGYLDRIDLFDYRFFGLSRREAELMDPQHRFALQLSQHALEDAGYRPASFRESRTAVVFSSPAATYANLVTEPGTLSMLGTVPCALPSRVAHLFGLIGPCYGVDTGCNGSMIAVHHACRELRGGDADFALAGGVSLRSMHAPRAALAAFTGIMSPAAKCRAFDADADGTVAGEGGAVLLLTTLERAIADRAPIYAVIRGSAVAHNGHQSATISTPSPSAQAAVIRQAWRSAGLELETAGYLETHGSGTKLGDAVEVEGLRLARDRRERTLPIGSVKTNIGHLDHAAGIAGMVKAILSLHYGEIYPSLHFERPADGVDLPAAGAEVATALRPWPAPPEHPRRAGVSSFSLGGINAHCVLEQPPPVAVDQPAKGATATVVGVSARTRPELAEVCTRLAVRLRGGELPLRDVAFTLHHGRDHYQHRVAVVARDAAELASALAAEATWLRTEQSAGTLVPPTPPRLVVLFSGDATVPPGEEGASLPAELTLPAPMATVVSWQLAAYQRLCDAGLPVDGLLSSGACRYAVRWLRGELSASDRAELANATSFAPADPARLRAAATALLTDRPVCFVELGCRGEISDLLTAELGGRSDALVYTVPARPDGLLATIGRLYESGLEPDWSARESAPAPRRVSLPGYPLRGERCWPEPVAAGLPAPEQSPEPTPALNPVPATDTARAPAPALAPVPEPVPEPALESRPEPVPAPPPVSAAVPAAAAAGSVTDWLQETLASLLYAEEVPPDADYFGLGGNSVIALQLIDHVQERYGVRIRLIDIYDHPMLSDLASAIQNRAGLASPPVDPAPPATLPAAPPRPAQAQPAPPPAPPQPPPITPGDAMVLSFGQERMWFHHQMDPSTTLYNLPSPSRIRGRFDPAALRAGWEDLAARHEVLRSNFVEDDGRPKLVIRPRLGDFFHLVDVSDAEDPIRAAREVMNREQGHVFDVANDPLVRVVIIRLAEDDHVNFTTMHHAVNDGWAPAVLQSELAQYIEARTDGVEHRLPPLPIQYRDYARWQRELLDGPALEAELDYWREQLRDPPVLELPVDFPRPARRNYAGDVHPFLVPADLIRELRRLSEAESTTLFTVVLAGLYVLLGSYSGQDDVVVGTPTIGRTRPELWQLIGFFNNTIALRGDLSGEASFRELIRRTRRVVMDGLERQEVPFDKVVKAVAPRDRDLGRSPLFDVMYVHQTLPPSVPAGVGRGTVLDEADQVDPFPGLPAGTAKFDLSLVLGEHAGQADMVAMLEYSTQLFTAATAAGMVDTFLRVLREGARNPDARCRSLAGSPPISEPPLPEPPLPEPPAGAVAHDGLAYWRQQLRQAPVLQLATDRPRPHTPTPADASHEFAIPTGLASQLRELAAGCRAELPDVLLAGYLAVLSARSEQDDLVVGVQEAAGLTAVRLDLSDEPGLAALVPRVREARRRAAGQGRSDLGAVALALGIPTEAGRHPLFDVTFAYGAGAAGQPVAGPFDLALRVAEVAGGEEQPAELTFRGQLFDRATVAVLAEEWLALLAAAVAEPDRPVLEIWLSGLVAAQA